MRLSQWISWPECDTHATRQCYFPSSSLLPRTRGTPTLSFPLGITMLTVSLSKTYVSL